MILLDTCALIFDALTPEKLSIKAKHAIEKAEQHHSLFCCDISFWEIAMLIEKKRLDPGTDTVTFLQLILQARQIQQYAITPEIAALSCQPALFLHGDPADRIIAATAIYHHTKLITSDNKLAQIAELEIVW